MNVTLANEPLDMLEELYFVHIQRMADAEREARLLTIEIIRLERQLIEAMARAEAEEAEATRIHRLAWNRPEVEA